MGFDRGALNAVLLATTAGLAIGGAIGVVSPTFAEAGPAARSRPPATVVTDVDVLGSDHMAITVRFGNTGRVVRHVAASDVSVSAGSVVLRPRTSGAVDVRPGAVVVTTFEFDPPPVGARLTLVVPGESLPL
ncbi:hypothetical protein OHA72_59910 [Dactylosporangium sp. NBC_01737]|uniref:hypothetical protein n=1 Tax=Dactylosporangium sp. NBC_01737 TaxID=2975959 RepID=UPI002E11DD3C|nr:hypothetical protein OHA72_59910 [Dactylosporangium sp. NBC_01737]